MIFSPATPFAVAVLATIALPEPPCMCGWIIVINAEFPVPVLSITKYPTLAELALIALRPKYVARPALGLSRYSP